MNESSVRVRFAPAPTGMMHLGNVRAALMNYLFARQKKGTFIIRIEDTDQQRNYDPQATHILGDLRWLGLELDEGPGKDGGYGPYFQSARTAIYQAKLEELISNHAVYRCFCTAEELEKKRQRQLALKRAPRYDRACAQLSETAAQEKFKQSIPFIWRFKIDESVAVEIHDLAHGVIKFEMKNFSDVPLTRQDGSFTFIFANFVDDMAMRISHVFRGEDHLTNTAVQAMLYKAFKMSLPLFWHLPIICNIDGKKLSKRDFGFSLQDLHAAGYLPQAICNYLAIIGTSFEQEIMSLEELTHAFNFNTIHATGRITYDVDKLTWVNRKWIVALSPQELTNACLPFLTEKFPAATTADRKKLNLALQMVKSEMATLADAAKVLAFYFETPQVAAVDLTAHADSATCSDLRNIFQSLESLMSLPDQFVSTFKKACSEKNIPLKTGYTVARLLLMGSPTGFGIKELLETLDREQIRKRLLQQ